jgi:hypothetical protein
MYAILASDNSGMTRWFLAVLLAVPATCAELKPQTLEAFERYVRQAAERLEKRPDFIRSSASRSDVTVAPVNAKPVSKVPEGLIHDWMGTAFLPGVPIDRVISLVQDYPRHKEIYKPEVIESRVLSRNGNSFHIYLRLLKKQVITVMLSTEHDVTYEQLTPQRWRSFSETTKIAEVENAGKANERERPPGTGEGFLWKLSTFWHFEERGGGTWVECEAISLTRDIPTGLGWIIEPIIRNLPKESLENTLRSTRAALVK